MGTSPIIALLGKIWEECHNLQVTAAERMQAAMSKVASNSVVMQVA
jgi:hypothetical protein